MNTNKTQSEQVNPALSKGAVIGSAFSPHEFRIGNYITSKSWFGSHKISGIEVFRDRLDFKVNGYVHSQIEGKYFDLDRIPLTVEWLINFGYTKREGSFCNQWWNGLNDVTHDWLVDITEMIDDGSFFYRNGKHVIKYVHELQNLHYMLSGEMLSLSWPITADANRCSGKVRTELSDYYKSYRHKTVIKFN